jgi:hypothetical protein
MRYALILPLLAAGPSGCRQGDESARNEVLEAVERYNGNLRRAYLEVNLDYLAGVAMEKQMSRIYPALEALRASGNTMIALAAFLPGTRASRCRVEGYSSRPGRNGSTGGRRCRTGA